MTLPFFATYTGVFLASSVVLAAVAKQLSAGMAASGKKPFVYGTLSSVIASGAAYLTTVISNHLFTVYWVLAGIYLLFGIIHRVLVHKKYFMGDKQSETKILLAEIMFGLSMIFFTVVIFSALQYFVTKEKEFLFYPVLMSTITFFLPFLFMKTFDAAFGIPDAAFKTWKYPLNEQIDVPDEKPGEKILVIGFEIAKKPAVREMSYFRAKAPEGMMLGELYYHFINDYNDVQSETPIGYAEGAAAHLWWFRRKPKWYQRQRILDPAISIRENGIKENEVIVCERISNHVAS